VHFYEDGRDELYDLSKDSSESQDLAGTQPEQAKALRTRLDAWLKSVDAQLPTTNAAFDPAADKAGKAKGKQAAKKAGE
jgi:hypothetical protein